MAELLVSAPLFPGMDHIDQVSKLRIDLIDQVSISGMVYIDQVSRLGIDLIDQISTRRSFSSVKKQKAKAFKLIKRELISK